MDSLTLHGTHIRLEPLEPGHADRLAAASAADPTLYQWSAIPQGRGAAEGYIAAALADRDAGNTLPLAIIRIADGVLIGSTRFMEMEWWNWPPGHPRHGRSDPDVLEIGGTWLTRSAIRTAANTEAKFLMLSHAFEVWKAFRVCLHTDSRNFRSQTAIERIGGKREGILRAHRMAVDFTPRDSARYSIIATEWPGVKERLNRMLYRG
ncbi:MAG: GNAT family N-acetyltransferase [Acidobacteriota bacterium]|jgi:RimJ/RimL family protein N-acetyltransferase